MHHPHPEGAFTLAQMLLRSPSGEREVDWEDIKSSCSRSPSPVECQGPPAEERPHPRGIQSLPCSLDLPSCTGLNVAKSPFICSECGKTFEGDPDLTQHQTVHTGHKSFICNECGRLFSTHRGFLQHQLTHHGEKLHVCSECVCLHTPVSEMHPGTDSAFHTTVQIVPEGASLLCLVL